jgi:hypothetical protein
MPESRLDDIESIGQRIIDHLLGNSGGSLARSWKRADRKVFCDVAALPILKYNLDGSNDNRTAIQALSQRLRRHLRQQCQGRMTCQRTITEARIATNQEISKSCYYEIDNRDKQIKIMERQSRKTLTLLVTTIQHRFRHTSCQRPTRLGQNLVNDLDELATILEEEKMARRSDQLLRDMARDPLLDSLGCTEKAAMFVTLTERFEKSRKERSEREATIMQILDRIATR